MPSLESANIVLSGNFNPYIISPEWLSNQNIWQPVDVRLALGALKKDGVQFSGEGTEWYVSSDRLVIDSKDVDCGDLAVKIMTALPHTPIGAVGSNFVYHDPDPKNKHPVLEQIRNAIPKDLNEQILQWGVVLHEDGVRREALLINGNQGTTMSFNHHRLAKSETAAIEAAQYFEKDKLRSEELLRDLFSNGDGIK